MNKKIALLVCFLVIVVNGYSMEKEGDPLEGINSRYDRMAKNSSAIRDNFDRQFEEIAAKRILAAKLLAAGKITQQEYDQTNKNLDRDDARVDSDFKDARNGGQKIVDAMQDIAVSFAKRKIDHEKAEDDRATIEVKRETEIGVAFAKQDAAEAGKTIRFEKMLAKDTWIKLTTTTVVLYGAYLTGNFTYKYFDAKLGMPTLIRQDNCSRESALHSLLWKKSPLKQEDAFAGIILSSELKKTVVSLAKATAITHEKGLSYRHLLLYGPPGTGKTLVAQTLARSSGMDFAMMSGADFSQFAQGKDVQELHKVFDWALYGKRGLVLFIDEADAFLSDRSKGCDERRLNLVNAFLSQTNSSSEKIMIILASNYAENLDSAVLSRINKKIEVPLPKIDERVKLLQLYIDNHLRKQKKHTPILTFDNSINNKYLEEIAQKIDGFSGRAIDQLIAEVGIECFISGNDQVNKELFDRVVEDKIQQYQKELSWRS